MKIIVEATLHLTKTILEAMYHLFFFKSYTRFDRWFEIFCGILAWIGLGLIFSPFIKLLF